MKILITVYFNSAFSGVHDYVNHQCNAIISNGHTPIVMCKPGPFSEFLKQRNITTIETDFSNIDEDAERALAMGSYDLVHAHPFAARRLGQAIHKRSGIPLIVTLHSIYLDDIDNWADDAAMVATVSPAARDFVVAHTGIDPAKVMVLPNGVDTSIYNTEGIKEESLLDNFPDYDDGSRLIVLASRFDDDKKFVVNCLIDAWQMCMARKAFSIYWLVAGDGAHRKELEQAASDLNQAAGRTLVCLRGWQDHAGLARLYRAAHLFVGPGRCVMDAMACGAPAIAVGSKGYVGLIDEQGIFGGVHCNFGGVSGSADQYVPGTLFRDIDRVIYDGNRLAELGKKSALFIKSMFDQNVLNRQLIAVYESIQSDLIVRTGESERVDVTDPSWAFSCRKTGRLGGIWRPRRTRGMSLSSDNGMLHVQWKYDENRSRYIKTGQGRFAKPALPEVLHVDPNIEYEISFKADLIDHSSDVNLYFIEYDKNQRLAHVNSKVQHGSNTLFFRTSSEARSFRVLLRFAGKGNVALSSFRLMKNVPDSVGIPQPAIPEMPQVAARSNGSYRGENLIFIVGPPRSGTTWILSVLREHPEIISATVDNLGARIDDRPTLETHIFSPSRPYTGNHIRHMFQRLSKNNPDKQIVEKTPNHLFHIDRIRTVFPKARFILVSRDGRDVVTSLVHVGRNPDAWWKGAPDSVAEACKLWVRYAEAALACQDKIDPLVVRYEDLLKDAAGEFSRLAGRLGISHEPIPGCVDACQNGRTIEIPGVYREGKSGGWREFFDKEDLRVFGQAGGDEYLKRLGYLE